MENRVKEREEVGEVCEIGIKEEIGVKVMVWAVLARSGLVGSLAGLGWVLSKFRRGFRRVLAGSVILKMRCSESKNSL
jgi:hypothetical protein